ncbi:MAG: hypothetical protein ACLVG5_03485 [Clostridium sp.]
MNYTKDSISFTVIRFMRCYIAAAEMYNIFWEQNGIELEEILFIPPGSATGPLDQLAEPYSAMIWIHPEFMKNIQQF